MEETNQFLKKRKESVEDIRIWKKGCETIGKYI